MLQNQEFIQEFVEEALVHVENVESGLLNMDETNLDMDNINNIFRAVHSMKGTAGFFGLKKIVELSHTMENIFGDVRSGKLKLTHDMVDVLLTSNDCLKSMLDDINKSEEINISDNVQKLGAILNGSFASDGFNTSGTPDGLSGTPSEDSSDTGGTSSGLEQNLLDNNLKHGHKLFNIRLLLNEDLGNKNISPMQFFKKLESVGQIIKCSTDISRVSDLDSCTEEEIVVSFVFTTVLEKTLLHLALDIPADRIVQADNKEELYVSEITADDSAAAGHTDGPSGKIPSEEHEKEAVYRKQPNTTVEDSVRVHVTLLNSLLNLASEMVLGRNQLIRAMDKHRKAIPGIDPILQNIDRITTELQERIMQTRMQPIANVFNKFPRITRDLAKKLGKEIDLQLEGTEVELDKSIIEALADPLTHLVRNAADHGLEPPEKRERLGKPRIGTINLKAYHEGGYVNIDVIDDGPGINVENIKQKALEKQLMNKAELRLLSEQEALLLLFRPGFSTADKITDVSGRGVGMDVVRTNIEKLGGTVEIFTKVGEGTTFRLLLPLTLAIIPSLIVEVEKQKFALPQVNLQEIVRIKSDDASNKIEYIHNAEVLRLRGKLLPIVHLADVLGLKRTFIDPKTGERLEDRRKTLFDQRKSKSGTSGQVDGPNDVAFKRNNLNSIMRILVLKIGSRRFGIAVDSIHGTEETLVKPLPAHIKGCRYYSGVTIMGDGKAALILDPEGIIESANLKFVDEKLEKTEKNTHEPAESTFEQQNLLLFKCSGNETYAIDLSLVSRVEEISAGAIEKIGEKEFIKFRGDTLRVIRPEDHLSVGRSNVIPENYYVIIPKLVKHTLGILIEKIHDTVQTHIHLNQEDLQEFGLLGSTILNDRIVLLVNIYELFEKADPEHYSVGLAKNADIRKTILIAEDTPFFQRMEQSYLEAAGYKVLLAKNGRDALLLLQENEVDLVVSDINMPVMDGLELIKKIREDKRLASMPVIAVTSLTGELQINAGLDAGFDYYEFKLDRARLLEKISAALKKKREAV